MNNPFHPVPERIVQDILTLGKTARRHLVSVYVALAVGVSLLASEFAAAALFNYLPFISNLIAATFSGIIVVTAWLLILRARCLAQLDAARHLRLAYLHGDQ